MSGRSFLDLPSAERQAFLERLALRLEKDSEWARQQGDKALEMVMRSVGTALLSVASDLAHNEPYLADDIAMRAIGLITTFHLRHPQCPVGPTLH